MEAMALIEIDGLPNSKMVDLSMAMLNNQRVYDIMRIVMWETHGNPIFWTQEYHLGIVYPFVVMLGVWQITSEKTCSLLFLMTFDTDWRLKAQDAA